ncbi:hypothetical protein [Paracraurococcus lichenis]|uniref:Phasin domain-containing protein n=1 Tax=Paracraurococcus lichenis TaxID=3064888 RepID=A0ABT9EAT6_9PROT|nr:hypothetical protein [Paracraurococcus sp. LOR1-02]MDO9713317.1 hypothetical protein [Paracraurococcus sp. LOR1-02]
MLAAKTIGTEAHRLAGQMVETDNPRTLLRLAASLCAAAEQAATGFAFLRERMSAAEAAARCAREDMESATFAAMSQIEDAQRAFLTNIGKLNRRQRELGSRRVRA